MIELRTLGTLELTSGDSRAVQSVLAQPRRVALLCYLALASPRGFHRRDTLFALFWPEEDAVQGRHALRQAVYFLRRALGPETIVSRGDDELALAPDQVRCDVWALEAAIARGRPADALALYRGEPLAGFHISGAPEFEHWLDQERARVTRLAVQAAWSLADEREREGDAAGAADAARCAVALIPEDETAIRRLMLLLERVGDRVAALRAYEAFAWKLDGEFELQPSAETEALAARIRAIPEDRLVAPPNPRRHPRSAAGNGNSDRVLAAGSSTRPRMPTARPSRESAVQFPGPVTEATPVSSPSRAPRSAALLVGAVVILLVLWLAGLSLRILPRDRTVGVPTPPPGDSVTGIAVLPFATRDSALANWHEGLVDLVSIDLTSVAGLRALDSRTLLARWRERADEETPALTRALEVAELAGARYAVVGSVIASGADLLLIAEVHEVGGRRLLGTARSQAPADSIFTLVDRLTLEIVRLILTGDARGLPRIDLARVSTASLPALKSYLEGEVLFRRSQFQRAAEAYAEAVDADSTFALARYRLGLSRWWIGADPSASLSNPWYAELGRFAERLPQHEAAILRANQLREQNILAARLLLEQEVRRYPDDAETWHELGELYHHDGGLALVPAEAADRAFARAIELDSTFTLPYIHRIEHAISTADTTGAIRLLGTFSRLAPESPYVRWFELITRFALGAPAAHSAAEAALDTLESSDLFWLGDLLQAPRCCLRLSEQVLRKALEHPEVRSKATRELFWVILAQGRSQEALGWVDDPFIPEDSKGPMLHLLDELGAPIPPARLSAALTPDAADSANAVQLFYAGSYAASRARWGILRGSLERLQLLAHRLRAAGDSSEAGFTDAVRQAVEGYALWRRGQRDTALYLLERSQPRVLGDRQRRAVNTRIRWWLGRLLREMGRPREALPYLESLTGTSLPTDYERGQIYEQLGIGERAREAYVLFLAPRQQADPLFQPMVQDARAAHQRLSAATIE